MTLAERDELNKRRDELAKEIADKFNGYTLSEASYILHLAGEQLKKRAVVISKYNWCVDLSRSFFSVMRYWKTCRKIAFS